MCVLYPVRLDGQQQQQQSAYGLFFLLFIHFASGFFFQASCAKPSAQTQLVSLSLTTFGFELVVVRSFVRLLVGLVKEGSRVGNFCALLWLACFDRKLFTQLISGTTEQQEEPRTHTQGHKEQEKRREFFLAQSVAAAKMLLPLQQHVGLLFAPSMLTSSLSLLFLATTTTNASESNEADNRRDWRSCKRAPLAIPLIRSFVRLPPPAAAHSMINFWPKCLREIHQTCSNCSCCFCCCCFNVNLK